MLLCFVAEHCKILCSLVSNAIGSEVKSDECLYEIVSE
jgi:hypothetical protein